MFGQQPAATSLSLEHIPFPYLGNSVCDCLVCDCLLLGRLGGCRLGTHQVKISPAELYVLLLLNGFKLQLAVLKHANQLKWLHMTLTVMQIKVQYLQVHFGHKNLQSWCLISWSWGFLQIASNLDLTSQGETSFCASAAQPAGLPQQSSCHVPFVSDGLKVVLVLVIGQGLLVCHQLVSLLFSAPGMRRRQNSHPHSSLRTRYVPAVVLPGAQTDLYATAAPWSMSRSDSWSHMLTARGEYLDGFLGITAWLDVDCK